MFMKATKIINVNIVENHIFHQDIWRGTFMKFMMAKKISLYTLWFKVNASES